MAKTKPRKKKPPQPPKAKEVGFHTTASMQLVLEHVKDDPEKLETLYNAIMHYKREWLKFEKDHTPLEILLAFYKEMDERETNFKPEDVEAIKCKKGCAHCCHIEVGVIDTEVELIINYIKEHNIPVDIDLLEGQLGLDKTERMLSPFSRCSFLADDNTCNIYPVRPMSCRKYFAVSEPEFCDGKKYPKGKVSVSADNQMEVMASALYNVGHKTGTLSDLLYEMLPEEYFEEPINDKDNGELCNPDRMGDEARTT